MTPESLPVRRPLTTASQQYRDCCSWSWPHFREGLLQGAVTATLVMGMMLIWDRLSRGGVTELRLGGLTMRLETFSTAHGITLPATSRGAGAAAASDPHPGSVPPHSPLGCRANDMCSAGKVRAWHGDVATNESLRQLLSAVAWKKEVMLTLLGNGGGIEAQMAVNLALSAEDLGLAHFFILARNQHVCELMPERYKRISCVWDSRPEAVVDPDDEQNGIWERRWELAARMLRMGYNVLSLDSDTMLHYSPYVFLKSGPLARYNALFQRDGIDGHGLVNCGVMYWQRAHPSGPSTWMAVEHADRAWRQRENATAMNETYPGWHVGFSWEQAAWPEMVASVASGVPKMMTVEEIAPPGWHEAMQPSGWERLQCEDVVWPPEWHQVIGRNASLLCHIDNITVPRPPSPTWWAENVRLFYSAHRGLQSERFMQLVRSASEHPMAEMDREWQPLPLPPENFAFLPSWFATGYASRGWLGYFGANQPPAQVASHLVYFPGSKAWKTYLFRGEFWWHWEVTEAFTGNNVLGIDEPRLLMLAPGVQLRTKTEPQFAQEVAKLARLATALGRRLVVPNPPCDSDWMRVWPASEPPLRDEKTLTNLTLWPEVYDGFQALQFPDRQRPSRYYCHWLRLIAEDGFCLQDYVQHADAVAYLARSQTPQQADPSAANTLYHSQWVAAGGREAEAPDAALEVAVADVAALLEAAEPLAGAPVLFLGAIPRLAGTAGLPPLPSHPPLEEGGELGSCNALLEGVQFEVNVDGQQNRQALLKARQAGGSRSGSLQQRAVVG